MKQLAIAFLILTGLILCLTRSRTGSTQTTDLALPQEKHLRNVKQLTFGGENAEAYFSADGKKLTFQSTRDGRECDQMGFGHRSDPRGALRCARIPGTPGPSLSDRATGFYRRPARDLISCRLH